MIAIIADTHLPRGRRQLPARCRELLGSAELIVHAGDFCTEPLIDELEHLGPLAAVHGNADEPAVRRRLPERLELTRHGVRLVVVHDAGTARGRRQRLAEAFPDADAVIFGHSHIPMHETDPDSGFQIFNPGSPTDKRRQPHFTMGVGEIRGGRIRFSILPLDPGPDEL